MTGQEVVAVSNGSALPHLESVDRIAKLPLVESALGVASGLYERVKESSSVANWTFTHAEGVGVAILAPVASRLETPIHAVDSIIAKGMDMVEEAVPAIKMTPKEVLDNTREMLASAFGLKLPESDVSVPARVVGAGMGAAVLGLRTTVTVLEDYMDTYHPVPDAAPAPSKPEDKNCESCKNEPALVINRWKVVLLRIRDELKIVIERRKDEAYKFLASVIEFIMERFHSRHFQMLLDFLVDVSRILQKRSESTIEMVNEIIRKFAELATTLAIEAIHFVANLPKEVIAWYKNCQQCGLQMLQAALQFALRNVKRLEPVNGCDSDERAKLLIARQGNGMAPQPRHLGTVPASILAKQDNLESTKKRSVSQEKTPTEDKASDSEFSSPITPKEKNA